MAWQRVASRKHASRLVLKDAVNQEHSQILRHNKKTCKKKQRDEIMKGKIQTE